MPGKPPINRGDKGMSFLFGKKPTQTAQALAEVLEDGREMANQEMKKPKYNNYQGPEVDLEVAVRVQPESEPPFDAKMKIFLLKMYLLKPGIIVRVKYDPAKKEKVTFDDDAPAILARNPQLTKQP
jgi:hypothetical protein